MSAAPGTHSSSLGPSAQNEKANINIMSGRTFHNTDSVYWLPNDDAENERLDRQHFAIKSLFNGNFNAKVRDYVSMDADNIKILDCGCGPGTWIMDIATEHPNCQFTGIDISDVFPKENCPPNVHFQTGNVLERLPFDDNTFDFISLRFLILAFRVEEWTVALKELYRVLKPGGVIESMECGQLQSGGEFIQDLAGRVEVFMESRGQDPHISLRISRHLQDAGLEVIETSTKEIHLGQSDPTNRAFLSDVISIYKGIKPFMAVQLNLKTDEEYNDFLIRLAIECQQEPEAIWPMTSTLARKPL